MVFATENDVLNGLGMLFMAAADQHAPRSSPTCVPSGRREATKRVTGYESRGSRRRRTAVSSICSTPARPASTPAANAEIENGNAVMKKWWEVTDEDIKKMTRRHRLVRGGLRQLPRRRHSPATFVTRAEMPVTMIRLNLVKGLGPVLQIAEGWTCRTCPTRCTDTLDGAHRPHHGPAPGSRRAATASTGSPFRTHTT